MGRRRSVSLIALGTVLALWAAVACGPRVARAGEPPSPPNKTETSRSTQGPEGTRYALLVGCTKYDNLKISLQLEGPANDVALMRELLVKRFDFPAKNVLTLSEQAGGEDGRPTRRNIERAFRDLARKVQAGDQVVIGLSGHAVRAPSSSSPDRARASGREPGFLPADVGHWDEEKEIIPKAITGNEFDDWLGKIVKKRAFVWAIVDADHSGGMFRLREPHFVALYAAQSIEPTFERKMPPDDPDGKPYGLFTYTLCQVLTRANSPLTYQELCQRVQAQYVAWGRTYPTPMVEGADVDREVCGVRQWPGRSTLLLNGDPAKGWKVNAGLLHGLRTGTILAVYSRAGETDVTKLVGHVRVTKTDLRSADVEPCAYGGHPKTGKLPDGGRVESVYVDHGDLRLRLAAEPADVAQKLRTLAGEKDSFLDLVEDPRKADWLVSVRDGKVYLLLCIPPGTRPDQVERPVIPPFPADNLLPELRDRLSRLVRARNLLRLAALLEAETSEDDSSPHLEVELVRYRDREDRTGEVVKRQGDSVPMAEGEMIAFRVGNTGKVPLYVTLLFVDSGYGIASVYPGGGQTAEVLRPRESFLTGRAKVTGETTGLEHLVAIAVKAEGAPVDFTCLEQPTMERARKTSLVRGGSDQFESPLGRLLTTALYAEGATRGLDKKAGQGIAFRLLPLRTFVVR